MKEILLIEGNNVLTGEVSIGGAKNSALALVAAAIVVKNIIKLSNVKPIDDIYDMISILKKLNVQVIYDHKSDLIIDSRKIKNVRLDFEEVLKLRASYYFMGALLSVFDDVEIIGPGGCNLGERPIDLHLYGFEKLGIKCSQENNLYIFKKGKEKDTEIIFDKISVGATVNMLLACATRSKKTIIEGIAIEPEIIDLVDFLRKMGVFIEIENRKITIKGNKELKSISHEVIPDRIEAGTFMIMGALLSPYLKISNININHLENVISVLEEIGVGIEKGKDYLIVRKKDNYSPINLLVKPYPGFPTDLQQPLSVLLAMCNGESRIEETIYPSRLSHVDSLNLMGANITIDNQFIIVNGPTKFKSSNIDGKDLRGGISLVLAALSAEGESHVGGVKYIKRGYSQIVNKIKNIGGKIKIIEGEKDEKTDN